MMRILGLCASPRRNGNSANLLAAFSDGASESGHGMDTVYLDDHISGFLRDCRMCRTSGGGCSITDGYGALLLERFLPAEVITFATPIYWYGVSGILKTFLDRMFCYTAASYPGSCTITRKLQGKKMVLLLSSEESYPGAELGIVHQFQEFARYTRSTLIGVVRGIGNRRGEVARDPRKPLEAARQLGRTVGSLHYSDYFLDSVRPSTVWPGPD